MYNKNEMQGIYVSVCNSDIDSMVCWGKRLATVDSSSSISKIAA